MRRRLKDDERRELMTIRDFLLELLSHTSAAVENALEERLVAALLKISRARDDDAVVVIRENDREVVADALFSGFAERIIRPGYRSEPERMKRLDALLGEIRPNRKT